MTNTIIIIAVLATNWVTISRTAHMCSTIGCTVHHGTVANQVGEVVTNYVARAFWNGKTNEMVLESVKVVNRAQLHRSIEEPPSSIITYKP